MNNRSHHLSPGRWGGEVGGNLGGGNYMVLRGNKGGISRGQQSINGRLKKIDCQLIANKECYGSFTESYGE